MPEEEINPESKYSIDIREDSSADGRESYRINPFEWRGVCFGRTLSECFWVGIHPTRWARAAYGGSLGSRSTGDNTSERYFPAPLPALLMPVSSVWKWKVGHWWAYVYCRTWKAVIGTMSSTYCFGALAIGLLLGHAITLGGSCGLNFMSW
jgi:hypothetical protein